MTEKLLDAAGHLVEAITLGRTGVPHLGEARLASAASIIRNARAACPADDTNVPQRLYGPWKPEPCLWFALEKVAFAAQVGYPAYHLRWAEAALRTYRFLQEEEKL